MKPNLTDLFGRVWGASGVQGFFGEGYRFHKFLGPFAPDFTGMTFVAKTTTYSARKGNTPLLPDFTPRDMFPDSVYLNPWTIWHGVPVNAWGLTGPGAKPLLATNKWQERKEPFMTSFMTVAEPGQQEEEVAAYVEVMKEALPNFKTQIGVQFNLSCPNTDADTKLLLKKAECFLDLLEKLPCPIIVKVSVDMPAIAVAEIAAHPACDGLCISNTVKFGNLPDKIMWDKYFGPVSPLKKYGGGGLSGAPLLPLTIEFVRKLREDLKVTKYINAGGGILRKEDTLPLFKVGADSVFLGSMAMLRPWRVQKTIRYVNSLSHR